MCRTPQGDWSNERDTRWYHAACGHACQRGVTLIRRPEASEHTAVSMSHSLRLEGGRALRRESKQAARKETRFPQALRCTWPIQALATTHLLRRTTMADALPPAAQLVQMSMGYQTAQALYVAA